MRHRDFRLLFVATFASNAGSWTQKVATAWLVYQMTGSEAWLGVDAFASGVPTVLLLPWGGVVADRVDRRRLLVWANVACAALAVTLAVLAATGTIRVWHVIATSALVGVVQAVMVPAAASLLPALVADEDVPNAISLNSLQFNLSRVLGPAVGGVVLVHLGAAWSFGVNAASFLVLVTALGFVRRLPPAPTSEATVRQSLAEGVRFVRGHGGLLVRLSMVGMVALLAAPVVSMLPALAKAALGRDASAYSVLLSAFGVGAVVAAAMSAVLNDRLPGLRVPLALLAVVGAAEIALSRGGSFPVAVALTALAGFAFVAAMIRLGTDVLRSTPDAYRGRVTGFQQIAFRTGQPVGALLAGLIASHTTIGTSFILFGVALLLATLSIVLRGEE